MSSAVSDRPEGMPSRTAVRLFPWDSPPVKYRNIGGYLKGALSVLQDDGSDKNQQFGLGEGDAFRFEQPSEERNPIEPGHALSVIAPIFFEDPSEYGGLPIAKQDFRRSFFLIDRRPGLRHRGAD